MTTFIFLVLAALAIAAVVLALGAFFDNRPKDDPDRRWEDAWRDR